MSALGSTPVARAAPVVPYQGGKPGSAANVNDDRTRRTQGWIDLQVGEKEIRNEPGRRGTRHVIEVCKSREAFSIRADRIGRGLVGVVRFVCRAHGGFPPSVPLAADSRNYNLSLDLDEQDPSVQEGLYHGEYYRWHQPREAAPTGGSHAH